MDGGRQILIADVDTTLNEMLSEQFQSQKEFHTYSTSSAAVAMRFVEEEHFDAIILGTSLSDMDGYKLCQLMRRNQVTSPIIILVDSDHYANEVLVLEVGATECVVKPFRYNVLLAKLRAYILSHEKTESLALKIGSYKFHPLKKLLLDEAGLNTIQLTDKEVQILKCLHRAGNSIVSRDVLLEKVWGYNVEVATHTLETHVYRLRQKIELEPSRAQLLVTEAGGYRLMQ